VGAEPQLRTERLLLRRWHPADRAPLAALNADPVVMEHFPATLSATESDALIERIEQCFEARGYGLWAVEVPGETPCAGFVGLWPVEPELRFAPAVELGWRLARPYWGRGLACEAASAAIAFARRQQLSPLLAYTAARNIRSRRLMERLGMRRDPTADFEHPDIPAAHPLAAHVLYRVDVPCAPAVGPDAVR